MYVFYIYIYSCISDKSFHNFIHTHTHTHTHTPLEKEMATHSSVLAWRIPGTEEPGGLPSMELHRVGHNWSDLAAPAAAYMYICMYTYVYMYVHIYVHIYMCVCTCLTVCDMSNCCDNVCDTWNRTPPRSSVHVILQAGILELVAMPSSRGSF